jgi:hypothetical protein
VKRSKPSARGKPPQDAKSRAAGDASLLGLISAKQAELAQLRRELDQARAALVASAQASGQKARDRRAIAMRPFRRSAKRLSSSPTAEAAYQVLRAARGPLHVRDIQARLRARRANVSVATLAGTLSRWVGSRAVFYRAKPNVFGLVEREPPRQGPTDGHSMTTPRGRRWP